MKAVEAIGIQFKDVGKKYYFSPNGYKISNNDYVVVDTVRGLELGKVIEESKQLPQEEVVGELKKVVRVATEKDLRQYEKNKKDSIESLKRCKYHIEKNELDMKLLECDYTLNRDKIIFYYNAEGRVDFRQLVKDLAQEFKVRIELRQVGVRDGAKFLGGLGQCGRVLCCSGHLREFDTVSIKMAKNQDLALSPQKISGICGKLLCCIKYENDTYSELRKELPEVGDIVTTPTCGGCRVVNVNLFTSKVKVQNREDQTIEEWYASEVKAVKKQKRKKDDIIDRELKSLEDN